MHDQGCAEGQPGQKDVFRRAKIGGPRAPASQLEAHRQENQANEQYVQAGDQRREQEPEALDQPSGEDQDQTGNQGAPEHRVQTETAANGDGNADIGETGA